MSQRPELREGVLLRARRASRSRRRKSSTQAADMLRGPLGPRARHPPQPGAALRARRADRERRAPVGADPQGRRGRRRHVDDRADDAGDDALPTTDADERRRRIRAQTPPIALPSRRRRHPAARQAARAVFERGACSRSRVLFGADKAGHTGSLDPLAPGLLPVCFGQATKVCGRLLESGKTYRVARAARRAHRHRATAKPTCVERAPVPRADDAERRRRRWRRSWASSSRCRRCIRRSRRGQAAVRAGPARRVGRARAARRSSSIALELRRAWRPTQLRVRRALLQGHLHPHAWPRTSRSALGTLGYVDGAAAPVGRPVRRPAHVHARGAGGASRRRARSSRLLPADTAFADLPRSSWTRRRAAVCCWARRSAAAEHGRGRASCAAYGAGRALPGPGRGRSRTAGSRRAGCSSHAESAGRASALNSAVLLEIIGPREYNARLLKTAMNSSRTDSESQEDRADVIVD